MRTMETISGAQMANFSLNCVFCEELFSTKEELGFHIQQCHNVPKPYLCKECNKRYALKGALKKHMTMHVKDRLLEVSKPNKDISCAICDYTPPP